MTTHLRVPVPEDPLRRLWTVPDQTGEVEVVPLLQVDVGSAQNLSDRFCKRRESISD